jgi:hypothetical protein
MDGKHMTKDEVLDLALEALELNNDEWKSLADSGDCGYWNAEDQDHYKQTNEAITAIKQARSAPVHSAERGEPVAWRWKNNGEDKWLNEYVYLDRGGPDCPEECEPLYTTPPAEPVQKRPQNCGTSYCSCIECVMEPAPSVATLLVQEPVAWMYKDKYGNLNQSSSPTVPPDSFPVYTTLPAPVVPDVLTTAEGEHPEYVQGWNDCRQLMLQTRNNRHD